MGTPMPFILSNNDQYRSTSYLQAKNPIGDDPKPETPATPGGSNMKSNRNNNNIGTTSTKTGRKNGKQGSSSQNKQPQRQRGVGIAQLERMIGLNGTESANINTSPNFQPQHHLARLHQIQVQTSAYPFIDPISASNASIRTVSSPFTNQAVVAHQKFGGTIGTVVGSCSGHFLGFHNVQGGSSSSVHPGGYYHGSDLRFRVLDHMGMKGLDGSSLKELPSFPKIDQQQGYYQDDQDVFASKKKKVMSGCNCYGYHMGGAGREQYCHDQGVEVVAVHRKGNAAGPGGGKVVMEYGFFPSAGKQVTDEIEATRADHQISHANKITTSLSVAPPLNYALPTTNHQPSVSLDLSLKL